MQDHLTLRRTAIWFVVGTLMFMTHYYSATLLLGQSAVLMWRHRLKVVAMWPAAFIAIPGIVWFIIHLPRLNNYASPDVSAYGPTSIGGSVYNLLYIFGALNASSLCAIVATIFLFILKNSRMNRTKTSYNDANDRNLWLTISASLIAFMIALLANAVQPSLTGRYLVPLVPSAMLTLVLMTQRLNARGLAAAALSSVLLIPHLELDNDKHDALSRITYNSEDGSRFVERYEPTRVLFVWDHPLSNIMNRQSLEELGSFFFVRSGNPVSVRALSLAEAADPASMLNTAAPDDRPAIIWLFGNNKETNTRFHPSMLEDDENWTCRYRSPELRKQEGFANVACIKLGIAKH